MVQVKVPATTANLGAGFDCLGLALNLFNSVRIEESASFSISITGQGERDLARDSSNLVYRAVQTLYWVVGRSLPPVSITLSNEIPLSRGLGSSAAAVVGGLVAANAFSGAALGLSEILELACKLEGHPDNVAAALYGGLTVAVAEGHKVECVRLPLVSELKAVLFIPDFAMSTRRARNLLPTEVSRDDAVFNISRAALMVAAMCSGRLDSLELATQDKLHQQYRKQMFPSMDDFFAAAQGAGARGVFLSGAGPTILALTDGGETAVRDAFTEVAGREGVAGRTLVLELNDQGAAVVT